MILRIPIQRKVFLEKRVSAQKNILFNLEQLINSCDVYQYKENSHVFFYVKDKVVLFEMSFTTNKDLRNCLISKESFKYLHLEYTDENALFLTSNVCKCCNKQEIRMFSDTVLEIYEPSDYSYVLTCSNLYYQP